MINIRAASVVLFFLSFALPVFAADVDLDNNGLIDSNDVEQLKSDFFTSASRSDLNGDGHVDFADLAILRSAFVSESSGAANNRTHVPTITMLPDVQSAPAGETVLIEIWVDFSNQPSLGGGFNTHYDETLLAYTGFEFDPAFSGDPDFERPPDELPNGVLEALAFGNFDGLNSLERVGTMTFTASAGGVTELTMVNSVLAGGGFFGLDGTGLIEVEYIGATVSVDSNAGLVVLPNRVSFGLVGQLTEQIVQVSNRDLSPVTIGDIAIADALLLPFSVVDDNCSQTVVQPDATCELTVRIDPVTHGNHADSFDIPSDSVSTPSLTVVVDAQSVKFVAVDLLPGECPNQLDVSNSSVRLAILGSADFDVNLVDVASIRFGSSPPRRSFIEDVATPFEPFTGRTDPNDCNDLGADGFPDLVLVFEMFRLSQEIGGAPDGAVVRWLLRAEHRVFTRIGPLVGQEIFIVNRP